VKVGLGTDCNTSFCRLFSCSAGYCSIHTGKQILYSGTRERSLQHEIIEHIEAMHFYKYGFAMSLSFKRKTPGKQRMFMH